MKIYELIEARRFPEKSQKDRGHEAALAYLTKIPAEDIYRYGVRMSQDTKLGINPSSPHGTALGIYYYPAEYYIKLKSADGGLPYMDEANFIQIVKINSNYDLELDRIGQANYNSYIADVIRHIPKIVSEFNISPRGDETVEDELKSEIQHWVTVAPHEAYQYRLHSGRFWYVLEQIAKWLTTRSKSTRKTQPENKKVKQSNRTSIIWNKLLMILEYDNVIDNGQGVIFSGEDHQGVVLDIKSIELVKIFKNFEGADPPKPEDDDSPDLPKPVNSIFQLGSAIPSDTKQADAQEVRSLLKSNKPPQEWIMSISKFFKDAGLGTNWAKQNQHIANVIVKRALSYLHNDPTIIFKIPFSNISFLIDLSDDAPTVTQTINHLMSTAKSLMNIS